MVRISSQREYNKTSLKAERSLLRCLSRGILVLKETSQHTVHPESGGGMPRNAIVPKLNLSTIPWQDLSM